MTDKDKGFKKYGTPVPTRPDSSNQPARRGATQETPQEGTSKLPVGD